MIKAGELTHRILLQKKSISQDIELNPVENWIALGVVWAGPLPKNGREFSKFSTLNSEITEVFKIRYARGVSSHDRIVFKNNNFEIIDAINSGEKNEELLLTCKAVV